MMLHRSSSNSKKTNDSKDNKEQKPEKEKRSSGLSFLSRKRTNTTASSNPPPNATNNLNDSLNNMKISQEDKQSKDKQDPKKAKSKSSKDEKEMSKTTSISNLTNTATITGNNANPSIPFDKVIIKANGRSYLADRVVGSGSFGVVVRAVLQDTSEVVAIKKVLQDKRYKNRELQIMQMLNHPNVVKLVDSFYTNGDKPGSDELYLNLVLEFIPDTVYRVSRHYSKLKQSMPMILVKLYTYQLLRSLSYIHSIGICHRDIKPQNLLLNPTTGVLKLCDFGSAKMLVKGEPNVSYICSRYYRAPELIFGSTTYTCAIDVWSAGCVLAELILGQPLFPGESGVDQLVEIIKVLGTPTREEIQSMNSTYTEYKFPPIKGNPWSKVFRSRVVPPEAIDLISQLLQYTPTNRLKPLEACAHAFFDELRDPNAVLPNGRPLPPIFNFTESEIKEAGSLINKLIPPHATSQLQNSSSSPTPSKEEQK